MKLRATATFAALASVLLCAAAAGQDAALRGLSGVLVRVEMNQTLLDDGLQKAALFRDVEEKLREKGIGVFTEDQWRDAAGHPQLVLEVFGAKVQDNWQFYTFSISLHLMQDVYFVRDGKTALHQAATWFRTSAGHGYFGDIRAQVIDAVEGFADQAAAANR